ncbi:MAG: selenocysteine-specific translation elongation factor [Gemmatimonadetes bacterium GWC2_71_9]|nr:MAG: selenocysteine-specific translation elongation factor [Gemmatimonadetes bacterium GWC2_71_9]
MERHVVVGTAGHIDHGKTALVKALTGVDTDRLAEEKARGITIDLGFAPLDLGGTAASIVDVPGHEGFIRNMVAGATGVDVALLVVAADEGVMPQTREHLDILRFLGVERGVVALTKCDLAPDTDWRELVAGDTRDEIARRFGSPWPVVEVSAATGQGLGALRTALAAEADRVAARASDDRFRLPVDRVFALAGAGTIVTGTVWSGTVREGDHVWLLPAGHDARVRGVQVHGAAATMAGPGRRAALALVGVAKDDLARGDVVVAGDAWRSGRQVEAVVTLLPGVRVKPRARVRVHHGTAEVMARISLEVAAEDAAPSAARIVLESPLVARAGDRFVLRSYSPVTTIGGGVIVDPWGDDVPAARRRRLGPAAAALHDDAARVVRLVVARGPAGLDRAALEVVAGLDVTRLTAVLARAAQHGLVESDGWLVAEAEVTAAATRLGAALAHHHQMRPLEPGMPAQAWRSAARAPRAALAELAAQRLMEAGRVVREGGLVRLPDWDPGAGAAARLAQERVLDRLRQAGAEPPSVGELKQALPGVEVGATLRLLARSGVVVAVAADRYYERDALEQERRRLIGVLEELGAATPADFRDRMKRSRKWLIPLLEWADREGVTVRDGDRRKLKSGAGP